MPAYMRDIEYQCNALGCKSRAVKEVVNTFNQPIGKFCRKHAEKRLKELRAPERTSTDDTRKENS